MTAILFAFGAVALLLLLLRYPRFVCALRDHRRSRPFSEGGARFFFCHRCCATLPHVAPERLKAPRLSQHEIDGNTGACVRSKAYNQHIADTVLAVEAAEAEPEPVPWPVGKVIEVPERLAHAAGGLR